jgi:NADH:ubiquinone oxidoreductase subunit 5 (subunit L)/multisubunit Na+/H+ antiporter MnhA subunit
MLDGDIFISASISIVLTVLMYFIVEQLTKRKGEIKKSRFSAVGLVLMLFYIILSIPTLFLAIHALNVEIYAKPEIQNYANEIQLSNMNHIEFFREKNEAYILATATIAQNALDTYVHTKSKPKKDSIKELLATPRFKINGLDDINRDNYKKWSNALKKELTKDHQKLIKSVERNTSFVENNHLHLAQNFSRLNVVNSVKELENMRNANLNQLNSALLQAGIDGAFKAKFEYVVQENDLTKVQDFPVDISSFSNLWNRYAPYWLLAPSLLFIIFLSLPYFLTRTEGTYLKPGRKKGGETIKKGGKPI